MATHDHDHDDHDHDEHHHHDHHEHDDHNHGHSHDDHDHEHEHGFWATLREVIPFLHGHDHHHGEVNIDNALEASARGIWALKVSLAILAVTAVIQICIFATSGSAGLLADTIHNFSDALTAIPLGLAFLVARRVATRRYTYGFGRAEDIAGTIIVMMILASALIAGYESYQKIVNPQPLQNVGWVMVAALVGFAGNEIVGVFRIRVGREIGSAALAADGEHARIDGFTSLAVFFGALGSLLGFPLADPIVGLLITLAILIIVKDTVVQMGQRLMDAVDPKIVDTIEKTATAVPGTQGVNSIRVRWLGHNLEAEMHVIVDEDLSTRDSHHIAEEVRHALFHAQPRLTVINIHVDPCGHGGDDPHSINAHHGPQAQPQSS